MRLSIVPRKRPSMELSIVVLASGILLVTSSPLSRVRATSPLMIDCAPQASIDEIIDDACGVTLWNLFIMIHRPGISKFTCCFSADHFVVFHVQ